MSGKGMKKDKGNDKDKYRKKPYTPLFKRDNNLKSRLSKLVEECIKKKIPKNSASKADFIFLDEYFINDPNLRVFLFTPEALKESFVELDSRGANLEIIQSALSPNTPAKKGPPLALRFYNPELLPHWEQIKKEYKERESKLKKLGIEKRVIKNSIERILALKTIPGFNDMNMKLIKAQDANKELKEVIDVYFNKLMGAGPLDYYHPEWGVPSDVINIWKGKYKTKSITHIWNERIMLLVNELKRIGYSKKQAYTNTAKLLKLAFPHAYKDVDPDLVRQRYTYHKSIIKE